MRGVELGHHAWQAVRRLPLRGRCGSEAGEKSRRALTCELVGTRRAPVEEQKQRLGGASHVGALAVGPVRVGGDQPYASDPALPPTTVFIGHGVPSVKSESGPNDSTGT